MGIICCKLLHLFCCPPCLSSIVTKLAFNPPTCSYCIIKNGKGQDKMVIKNETYDLVRDSDKYVEYHTIRRDSRNLLSCVHIRTARWSKDTILLSHGNAVDLGMILGSLIDLGMKLKVNIVAYDYSGYGLSSGQPSERLLYVDVATVFDYVRQSLDIPLKNIIVYGQSIGSVPSTYLGTRYKFGMLILHSPLASGFRLIQGCNAMGCCDVLDNASRAGAIRSPTLVIHGVDDSVIPVEHSYHILRRIPQSLVLDPLFIPEANHNDCEMYPEYMARLKAAIGKELPIFQNNFTDSLYSS